MRLRLLVVGADWPTTTFLDRLLRGLAARTEAPTFEIWLAGSGRAPRDLPTAYRWLRVHPGHRPAPLRALGLAASVVRGTRAPRRLARSLGRLIEPGGPPLRSRLQRAERLLPYTRRNFDVAYFPWNTSAIRHLDLVGLMPSVVSCRGSQVQIAPHDPARSRLRSGLPRSFAAAQRVHCVSRAMLREAMEWGLDPAKAEVIHPAIDVQRFSPFGPAQAAQRFERAPGGPLRCLAVGTLIWRKALSDAIRAVALARAAGSDVRLDIIGDGFDREHLEFTVRDLDLREWVRLLGAQPPDAVLAALRSADAFVHSALSEGISNSVLEAMACGLPVVSTDCGGMGEAIVSERDGLLVPTRDPAALARALTRLADEPALRARLGTAARERVARDFRLERQIKAFAQLLAQAAASGGGRW